MAVLKLHTVELKDQDCNVFYDKLKFIYVERPQITKPLDQLASREDQWLCLLWHLPDLAEHVSPLPDRYWVFCPLKPLAREPG